MKKLRRKFYLWMQKRKGREVEDFNVHGVNVHIPAHADHDIRYLLARGRSYEGPEARLIQQYLEPDMPVVELGGCMGVISAVIRRKIGPDACHLVVEADAGLAVICKANAMQEAANGATKVVVAAVDYSGVEIVTFASGKNAHVGHIAAAGEAGAAVPTVSLSALAQHFPDGRFALVCDIEGAEVAMFENETALLGRLEVIILETHPKFYDGGQATEDKMLTLLAEHGLYVVARDENVVCLKRAG